MRIEENPLIQAIIKHEKYGQRIFHQDSRTILIKAEVYEFMEFIYGLSLFRAKYPTLIVTDPPYEFESRGGGLYKESESMDKIQELGTDAFDFKKYVPKILANQYNTVGYYNAYFFCNLALIHKYIKFCEEWNLTYDILIMDRASAPPAHSSHYVAHLEYCIFIRRSSKSKNAPFIGKAGGEESVAEDRWRKYYRMLPGEVRTEHPNEKPLNFIKRLIMNSSKEDDFIFDPFIGSGTTAIAARDLDRFCIGVDKSIEALEIAAVRLKQLTLGL